MRVHSTAWSEEARFAHTRHMVEVCPPELMPTVSQNMASGGLAIRWPDVCHCHVNGGATLELHALAPNCDPADGEFDRCSCGQGLPANANQSAWLQGTATSPTSAHIDGCPFDTCPLAQCHPMCSQVTGDGQANYCHCPCHG
jgi:hypothetical protein